MIPFSYNDGGRKEAGRKGVVNDCVCRAICIATGKPYNEVWDFLADNNQSQRIGKGHSTKKPRTADKGINTKRKWFSNYMESLGFEWVPTMKIGSGCQVHLKQDELPSGTIIVNVSKHFATVVDGVLNDTYDSSRAGTRCVYGYYKIKQDNGKV